MIPTTLSKNVNETPIMAVGGHGVWIETAEGRTILDTCGGVAVSSLGHRHPRIAEAMIREAENIAWVHAGSFTTPSVEALSDFLVSRSGGMVCAQFLSGGSEAMELAIKIALQVQQERAETRRRRLISRHQSYHGSTLGLLRVSGNPARRYPFDDAIGDGDFVQPCYSYRGKLPGESEPEYVQRLANDLEEKILSIGPSNVAAFLAEPVVGSAGGAIPFCRGYLSSMQSVCRRHGVLFIIDDVMSGMGRTGYLFSHLEECFVPDIVAVGKGLAAGYQPLSAVLLSEPVFRTIANGSGVLRNGQTNVNHPIACAIALEVQRTIEEEGLLDLVKTRGELMRALLRDALSDHSHVGDIRGKGLMIGVEFVTDRTTKSPPTDTNAITVALKKAALARDLLIYPGGGTADGKLGNHVMFAPPFIASEDEIALMVQRFVATLGDVRVH
jgi:adenosylmethionine-8-amino-7-oxononanoate aminotransferase